MNSLGSQVVLAVLYFTLLDVMEQVSSEGNNLAADITEVTSVPLGLSS